MSLWGLGLAMQLRDLRRDQRRPPVELGSEQGLLDPGHGVSAMRCGGEGLDNVRGMSSTHQPQVIRNRENEVNSMFILTMIVISFQ